MRSTTEPLHVVCKLLDGRVFSTDGLFFLDSILYHAWFMKYDPDVLKGTKSAENPKHFGLPLRQLDNNRYAASMGFFKNYGVSIEYWNKHPRWDKRHKYLDDKGTINAASGRLRAYRMPCVIRHIGEIHFWAYGTIDKVKDLLAYIPAVGKKPAAGWGTVKEWVVEPWHEDWSTWSPEHGLMRPIPIDEGIGHDLQSYKIQDIAIRPPAWKAINQATCWIPEVLI